MSRRPRKTGATPSRTIAEESTESLRSRLANLKRTLARVPEPGRMTFALEIEAIERELVRRGAQ